MKNIMIAALVFSVNAFADGPTYYKNDRRVPEIFSSKTNEIMDSDENSNRKVIRSTTTSSERQEEELSESSTTQGTASQDKPVLDSNPNDETYKIGPLDTREPNVRLPEVRENSGKRLNNRRK